jgi:hypothetical protein
MAIRLTRKTVACVFLRKLQELMSRLARWTSKGKIQSRQNQSLRGGASCVVCTAGRSSGRWTLDSRPPAAADLLEQAIATLDTRRVERGVESDTPEEVRS